MITETRTILSSKSTPPPPQSTVPSVPSPVTSAPSQRFKDLFSHLSNPLEEGLVSRVHQHVKGLNYHPNTLSPNSPEIFLYGDDPYRYNKQSSEILPMPIICSLPMTQLLISVNAALKTNYNSMLINKYKNLHSWLSPHKDNERSLEPTSPISALSLGATRRLQISPDGDKDTVTHTVKLA